MPINTNQLDNLNIFKLEEIDLGFLKADIGENTLFLTQNIGDTGKIELGEIKDYLFDSPILSGIPTAPTALQGTNSDQVATTQFVITELGAIGLTPATVADFGTVKTDTTDPNPVVYLKSSVDNLLTAYLPLIGGTITGALTLNSTLTVVGNSTLSSVTLTAPSAADNSNRAITSNWVKNSFAPLASPVLSGTPTAPTASAGTNTLQIATTAFVQAVKGIIDAAIALKANIASPALTGTPTTPTAPVSTNTTQIASTAFVRGQIDNDLDLTGWRHVQTNISTGSENKFDLICSNFTTKDVEKVRLEISNIKGGAGTTGTAGLIRINDLAAFNGNNTWANTGYFISTETGSVMYTSFTTIWNRGATAYTSATEIDTGYSEVLLSAMGNKRIINSVNEKRIVKNGSGGLIFQDVYWSNWSSSSFDTYIEQKITALSLLSYAWSGSGPGSATNFVSGIKIDWFIKTKT